jgi:hypothetical protein
MSDTAKHHIWCNFWGAGPASECRQCKFMFANYPMDDMTPDELQKKHFPNVIKRPGTDGCSGDQQP